MRRPAAVSENVSPSSGNLRLKQIKSAISRKKHFKYGDKGFTDLLLDPPQFSGINQTSESFLKKNNDCHKLLENRFDLACFIRAEVF